MDHLESPQPQRKNQRLIPNSLFEHIFLNANDSRLILDSACNILRLNQSMVRVLGYDSSEIEGQPLAKYLVASQHDSFCRRLDMLEYGRIDYVALCLIGRSGLPVNISAEISKYELPEGRFVLFSISHQSSARTHDNPGHRLVTLIENSGEFFGLATLEGNVIYMNRTAMNLVGIDSLEEAVKKNMYEYPPEDRRSRMKHVIIPAVMKYGSWTGEEQICNFKTGKIIDVYAKTFLITDDQTDQPMAIATIMHDISHEKAVETALQISEQRFRDTADLLPEIVFEMDTNGLLTFVNEQSRDITGYTKDDVKNGFSAVNLFVPEDRESARMAIVRRIKGETNAMREFTAQRKDGTTFPVIIRSMPIVRHGSVVGLRGIVVDISEQKTVEWELTESRRKLSTILGNLPGMAYRRGNDDDWSMEYVSSGCRELTGYSDSELVGDRRISYTDIICPDDRERVKADILRDAAACRPFAVRYRIQTKTAEVKWVWERGTVVCAGDGSVEALEGLIIDITEQVDSENALKASEDKYRNLFEASANPILIVDSAGHIIDANCAWTEFSGYTKQESRQINFAELIDSKSGCPDIYKEIGESDHMRNIEVTIRRKSDQDATCLVSGSIHRDYSGVETFRQLVIHDISELRRLESQLVQAQKMESVARLAGGIAHDFNNILTAIMGNTDLLLATLNAETVAYQDAKEIKNISRRAAELTRQLLAFSRRQIIRPRVINLNTVIEDMDRMLRRLIGEDISLKTALELDLRSVKIDPGQVEQIVTNLVVNARDSITGQGSIVIKTANVDLDERFVQSHPGARTGEFVMLSVSDSGHGIPEDVIAHIFEPFFTTKDKSKGTGLGLSISYGIVKQNTGTIWVDSAPGNGTEIKVFLPYSKEMTETDDALSSELPPPEEGNESLLVVEDQPELRNMVVRVLRQYGYTVYDAEDGIHALAIADSLPTTVDLVITDVVMPRMGGRDLAEQLMKKQQNIRVLFMSGYTDDAIVEGSVLQDGIAFLPKPFTPDTLLRAVRRELSRN